jgi:protein-tyrosine phosphatase
LGGYRSADGRRIKWGAVYRSGELSQLSDEDVGTLAQLGIKTVVDLRSPEEIKARGEGRLPEGAELRPMPIASSDLFAKIIPQLLQGDFSEVPLDLLGQVNRALVRDYAAEYRGLLHALLDAGRRPLVFHCTQGKDRAGFGAVVVLSALGVPWETVLGDYLLSNHYREAENEKMLGMLRRFAAAQPEAGSEESAFRRVEGLLYVKEQSLGAAHQEILSRYGSVDGYLVEGLGCSSKELERLRDELLE